MMVERNKTQNNITDSMHKSQPKRIYKHLDDLIHASPSKPSLPAKPSRCASTQTKQKPQNLFKEPPAPKLLQKKEPKFIMLKQRSEKQSNPYNWYYHQVDAMFTDLEDYLCKGKQQLLSSIQKQLEHRRGKKSKKINEQLNQKVEELKKMCDYIKHIGNYFLYNEIPGATRVQTQPLETCQTTPLQNKQNKFYTQTSQIPEGNNLQHLSTKQSKSRINTRMENITNRKKTVYETILQESRKRTVSKNKHRL